MNIIASKNRNPNQNIQQKVIPHCQVIPGADSREINHIVEETFGRYTSKALKRNGKGVAIVWFRNDLRVLDNEALLKAWDSSEMVLPVYCVDPRHSQTTYHFGFPKTGALRAQFLIECLADLRKNLMNRGLNLLIRHGKPEEIIPSLAKSFGAHAVDEELNVERLSIEAKCTVRGCIRIPSSFGPPPSVVDWGSVPLIEQLELHSPKASLHGTQILIYDAFRRIKNVLVDTCFAVDTGGPRKLEYKWSQDQKLFESWRDGCTGYPLIDANMKELSMTGFMSNRGRQIACSFLVRDMGIDWRMGAEWFETCLLDYDPCSNYGNWTYGAGVGNDPREDRYFSIPKQAQNYDREGEYVAYWLPQLKALPKERRNFPGGSYIEQIVSLKHGNINQNRNQNDSLTRTGRRNNFKGKHAQVNR
ncbi:cryptochrome DASH [Citrus sinensis]|uniref:Cryptochrome DASH n=1 Tax=Citrus sinensis TaxID=2711 RepID=A0ACB8NK58_CITSI|nr:cryptochrome DASH [Citrus sinensis]